MQSLKNIWTLTLKEWRSLFGDRVMSVLLIVVFTALVYQSANGVSTDVKNATVGVIDLDRSPLSQRIIDALPKPYFAQAQAISREEASVKMDRGDLVFVLEFPPNFQRDVLAGRAPEVQLLIDATTMTQAGVGQSYINQIFQRELMDFLGQRHIWQEAMPVQTNINIVFNPNGQSEWLLGAMEVNNMITLLGLVLVGAAVIREREHGTIEHLLVMPVSSTQMVLAKMLANGLVVCTAATLSMNIIVGGLVGAQFGGSLWLYFVGSLVFMFSISALAVLMATVAPTMPQYSLLMVPVYVVTRMFSGANSPRSNMPEAAQWVSEYWTTTQFTEFAQNVLFRGAGWSVVWEQLAMMAVGGLLCMGWALVRFRKMLEKQG